MHFLLYLIALDRVYFTVEFLPIVSLLRLLNVVFLCWPILCLRLFHLRIWTCRTKWPADLSKASCQSLSLDQAAAVHLLSSTSRSSPEISSLPL